MPENTRSSERKQQNLKEWERYLTILEMRQSLEQEEV